MRSRTTAAIWHASMGSMPPPPAWRSRPCSTSSRCRCAGADPLSVRGLLAALELLIHLGDEPVGTGAGAGRQQPARNARVVRRRHVRGQHVLLALALRDQLLNLAL